MEWRIKYESNFNMYVKRFFRIALKFIKPRKWNIAHLLYCINGAINYLWKQENFLTEYSHLIF